MSAETDKRSALLHKSGDNNLALSSIGNRLACFRVDYLNVNVIVPVMDTPLIGAVDTDTRTVNFRQTVNIIKLDTKSLGNGLSHLLAPSLRAENAFFKMDLVSYAPLVYPLRKQQRIGGCGSNNSGF